MYVVPIGMSTELFIEGQYIYNKTDENDNYVGDFYFIINT